MKQKYIITMDKEKIPFSMWDKTFEDVKDLVEIAYQGVCLEQTARKRFNEIVLKQSKEYHTPGNTKPWRVIRLFDSQGNQIAQES